MGTQMLTALDHVNLHTADVEGMAQWYHDILGLVSGLRPDFKFPGAWLYLGDVAVVHLVHSDKDLSTAPGSLEHFAFRATGLDAFEAKLKTKGIAFKSKRVPDTNITQVNLHDPMGTHLHIDFRV